MGKPEKLAFDYVARAYVACRRYASPQAPKAATDWR